MIEDSAVWPVHNLSICDTETELPLAVSRLRVEELVHLVGGNELLLEELLLVQGGEGHEELLVAVDYHIIFKGFVKF